MFATEATARSDKATKVEGAGTCTSLVPAPAATCCGSGCALHGVETARSTRFAAVAKGKALTVI